MNELQRHKNILETQIVDYLLRKEAILIMGYLSKRNCRIRLWRLARYLLAAIGFIWVIYAIGARL